MRHRIASYSEESARYRQLEPAFYVPDADRKLVQTGKVGAYHFEAGSAEQVIRANFAIRTTSLAAYAEYDRMLVNGIAREVARMVLPVNIYSTVHMTINARSLMNVLSLRVIDSDSTYPSFPQWEIEQVARQMEEAFAEKMPVTHAAFVKAGRVAP
jgi:thymidylate synthase (FAD)